MELLKDKIYFKSIDRFFPRASCTTSPHVFSADDVVTLSNINIFLDCKCNIAIYTESGNAFYVDVRILNQSEKRDDLIASFLKIEKLLDQAYGRKLIKQGRISWALFESVSSKRKINNAVIEHRLYEHFGFCESITVKLAQHKKTGDGSMSYVPCPIQSSTYGNSDKRTYTYDAPGRLIGIKNNNINAYSWTYSGSGVANTYTDSISGRKYNYTYDSLGRIISQTGKNISDGSAKSSSTYTYDISNNLTKLVNSAGTISLSMSYSYDSVNRPTKSYYTSNTQATYTYDALGRLASSSLKLTSSSFAKSYEYHNSANYSGKTTNQIKTENLGDRGYQYTYDRVSRINE